jgi:hypothetical protein
MWEKLRDSVARRDVSLSGLSEAFRGTSEIKPARDNCINMPIKILNAASKEQRLVGRC